MVISELDREDNIVGKGEKAPYEHVLLFKNCFRIIQHFRVV